MIDFTVQGIAAVGTQARPRLQKAAVRPGRGISFFLAEPHGCYVLIDLTGPGGPGGGEAGGGLKETLESILAGALEDAVIADAVIAASEAQAASLWQIR